MLKNNLSFNTDEMQIVVEQLHEGLTIVDLEENFIFVNASAAKILGYSPTELHKINFKELVHPQYLQIVKDEEEYRLNGKSSVYDLILFHKNGSKKCVQISASPYRNADGKIVGAFGLWQDITEKKRDELVKSCIYKISEATHAVEDLDELYKQIHEILSDVLNTRNFYIALVDWKNNKLSFPYFVDEVDNPPGKLPFKRGLTEYVLKTEKPILVNPEKYYELKDSGKIDPHGTPSVDWLGVPLKTSDNGIIGVLTVQSYNDTVRFGEEEKNILQYVSDQIAIAIKRKQDELKIQHQAFHDQLSGLTNKVLFNDRLEMAITQATRLNQIMAVMFIDLDNFKYVNDSMGHTAGDLLIKEVAIRLKKCLRKSDTVARWGGDEFTILLSQIRSVEDSFKLAKRILNDELSEIVIEGKPLRITASIGISLFPHDGTDAQTLIKNADTAMYRAKESGKNCYCLFRPKMNAEVIERLSLENGLMNAIEKNEFVLHYQPQVELISNNIIGFEALVRWNSPADGIVAPMRFIPLAEETNLILPLGEWILNEVCKQTKRWQENGHPKICAAVNLSAKQFAQKNIVHIVQNALETSGLEPKYLELELTESIIMENAKRTIQVLKEFKNMGIQLSIDDFGTGYSSLSYLRQFPIDTLKIDKAFITDLTNNESDATIANLVIDLGHNLGLNVIAEGVETQEQVSFLKTNACDKIQGFLVSHPVEAVEFEKILSEGKFI
jgi:diguanylate cyclase (GGDEF)-like protein/PAS domain S-box-containing protein